MNILKSAFNISKSEAAPSGQLVYEDLKAWDGARAKVLGRHLRVVELVMEGLDGKVRQVEGYIGGLERLMRGRIEEIVQMHGCRAVTVAME